VFLGLAAEGQGAEVSEGMTWVFLYKRLGRGMGGPKKLRGEVSELRKALSVVGTRRGKMTL